MLRKRYVVSAANFSVTWSHIIRSRSSMVLPSHKAKGQSCTRCLIGLQTLATCQYIFRAQFQFGRSYLITLTRPFSNLSASLPSWYFTRVATPRGLVSMWTWVPGSRCCSLSLRFMTSPILPGFAFRRIYSPPCIGQRRYVPCHVFCSIRASANNQLTRQSNTSSLSAFFTRVRMISSHSGK